MAGIAGIAGSDTRSEVERMLQKMTHRGKRRAIFETRGVTLGAAFSDYQENAPAPALSIVRDYVSEGHFAQAQATRDGMVLRRDPLGLAPLYYGRIADGTLCFASEVKALLEVTRDVREIPPGSSCDGTSVEQHFRLQALPPVSDPPDKIAPELRGRLERAVSACVRPDSFGAWLSGGLDSSALVALARPLTSRLHTFAAGLLGAPDLDYARAVSEYVKSDHHEAILTEKDLLSLLPLTVYHLESFDALLVRSSIMNCAASRVAADFVPAVLSGEGGDELFAGYEYLKTLPIQGLEAELLDIIGRLHNTALQRVDRSAAAFGLTPHVCFLDPAVVEYALQIPVEYKLRNGVEKWILRQALAGRLPDRVLNRPKAKFWQGAGVQDILARHADETITDADFGRERRLPNGWDLNTKEELMYYRVFRERFGMCENYNWMGRTKNASRTA